jgi:hypothetical protein
MAGMILSESFSEPMYPRSLIRSGPGPKSPKILLQNCDGRFQIERADQTCRECERRLFAAVREHRHRIFAGGFAALVVPDYQK